MATTFLCPHCEAKLQSNNPHIEGKRVRCAKCNATFTVKAGLIVRDEAVRTATAERSKPPAEQSDEDTAPRPKAKGKKKTKKSSMSSTMYWARTFIALALLIVIVTVTVVILINKGWL